MRAVSSQQFLLAGLVVLAGWRVASAASGWDCHAGPDGNWVCAATGKGVVEAPSVGKRVAPVPTHRAEPAVARKAAPVTTSTRATTAARCDLPTARTASARKTPPAPSASPVDPATLPLYIEADAAKYLVGEGIVELDGRVFAERGPQQVRAGHIRYDSNSAQLQAEHAVEYRTPRQTIRAARADLRLDTQTGELEQVGYFLPASQARGTAAHASILSNTRSSYREPTYTTCPSGNNDWLLRAEELEIDQQTGVGKAKAAKLVFKGVPLMYLPWASFPLDDRRKSGFLLPRIGYSTKNGVDVQAPYYFNLAPNHDLTLTPRLVSKRGLMLAGQFRYLTRQHNGILNGEILPDDRLFPGDNSSRGAASWRHHTRFSSRLAGDISVDWASDADYLDDLSNRLAISSTRHLERSAMLNYYGDGWRLLGRLQDFQTLDLAIPANDRPYARLPQLLFQLNKPDQWLGTTLQLDAEYVYFSRTDSVRGSRVDIHPAVSLPLRRSWGFVTPKIAARYTTYALDNNAPDKPDTPSRSSASLSLDSGLFFERKTGWFGHAITQTLEPRLFYLYRTRTNQDELPVFDTDDIDFSFVSLFYEDRFSGADRVGDANRVTLAVTSRLLDERSGRELARGSIGQIYYLADRSVQLPGHPVIDEPTSSLVAEGSALLSPNWDIKGSIQWNPSLGGGRTEKSALRLGYHDEDGHIATAAYRFTRDISENAAVSMVWPVSPRLRLIGRLDYSMLHETMMETVAGFEYGNCCWAWQLVARNYLSDPSAESNLTFLLQLELRGLGKLGNDIDDYLKRNIRGYRSTYE